jgi:signal transduction histidine kinase
VSDTGIGIPTSEQPRLFTRFFRSSSAHEASIQGTGLGLVIVKSIVEHHGGSIELTSAPAQGTTVTVRLPAGTREVAHGSAASARPVPALATHGGDT